MPDATAPRAPSFAFLVQQFFTEYLVTQRALSPRTIASYRDALKLFLDFAHQRLRKMPTALRVADIEPDLILAFLDHLEQQRHNTVRSRNLRLTALRAFLKFAAPRDVSSLYIIERALGVPMKRFERPMLGFLSREEMLAVMGSRAAPGLRSAIICCWPCSTTPGHASRRSSACGWSMWYSTGQRASIFTARAVSSVRYPCGRPRFRRSEPACATIQRWLAAQPCWNRIGQAMTRANVNQRLDIAVTRAAKTHHSLTKRSISPHCIRHTTAMHLLQSGVDFSVIALCLGHESVTTTHRYVEADLAMKDKALARLQPPGTKMRRYRLPDALMQFLQAL
jgi:site-specific recombinase XerD